MYRVCKGIKNLFTASDMKYIVESFEFGEKAAQKAYEDLVQTDE